MTANHPYPAHVVEAVAKALWETAPASQVIGWDDLAPQDSQHSDYTSKANTALNALWESDNHEHTPSIEEEIRHDFSERQSGAMNRAIARQNFDRMIAAAEQRGAARALRDAATAIEKNNIVFDGDHYQPCNSCMSIHMNWLDYRADQIEADDD